MAYCHIKQVAQANKRIFAVLMASAMARLNAAGINASAIAFERSIYPNTGVTGRASPNLTSSLGGRCFGLGLRVPLGERLALFFFAGFGLRRCQTALTLFTSPIKTFDFAFNCESLFRGMLPYLFSLMFLG
jgi:hypothetical protein